MSGALPTGGRALQAGCCLALAVGCVADGELEQPKPQADQPPVEYPVELWEQDVQGTVLLRVLVNREGRADSVELVESSGHAALDSAAASGIEAMEFEPAKRGAAGASEAAWVRVPVTFSKTPPPTVDDAAADAADDAPRPPS